MSSFRFPDGVEFNGENDEGHVLFRVSIPTDEHGFFGRQCPHCAQIFRVSLEDYDAAADDLRLWCVYCGHEDDHSEFLTQQQRDRTLRAASDYGVQLIQQHLGSAFRDMERRSRGAPISFSYRSRPFYPQPLPEIDEERLVRERACGACGVRYAVFGEHRFCPFCGPLTPLIAATDALDAELARLDALTALPPETADPLRERGVFDRTFADTIENLVTIIETLADAIFTAAVPTAPQLVLGKGKVFQRLDDLADLYAAHLGVDLRSKLGSDWAALLETWAARHVFTHCDGIIDAKYLGVVPSSTLRIGQRLRVNEPDVRAALERVRALCRVIAGISPVP